MTFYLGGSYSIPEGNSRAGWYGFTGTPSAVFDGVDEAVGGQQSGSMFASYQPMYLSRAAISSPLVMNAAFIAIGNQFSVSATIQVDEAVSGSNNQVHFFVCQEGYHNQSNMVVDMLNSESFTLNTPGQSTVVSREFTLASNFTLENLRIIVVVQNMSTKEILQATLASADYSGTLVVDANPDGVDAPWNLTGPNGLDLNGTGDTSLNMFFTGDYTLTFLDIPAWTLPASNPQSLTLSEGGLISFEGQYTDGPFLVHSDGPLGNAEMGMGISLIDYDRDGDLDIHVLNDGSADQLLRNDGDLSFTDVATGLIADTGASRSGAWADFNRDGHLDLILGKHEEANVLLSGDGAGGFVIPASIGMDDAGPATSVSWCDYDLDGILDAYIANQGTPNLLMKNLGDLGGGFYIFTSQSGPVTNDGQSLGVNWIDLTGDQRPELFISNSFSGNVLLENTPIGFSDFSYSSGLADVTNGTGCAWGDYDNDGDFDLYLCNDGMSDHIYDNGGDLHFAPLVGDLATNMGHGRGVVWADFNNDTNLDVYVVRHNEPDYFLLGDGTGQFTRVPVGPIEANGTGNAIACGDLDNDGDIDVFITREGMSNLLLSNELAGDNNFLELTLVGSADQPDAIGAQVRLTAGGISQIRNLSAGSGYLNSNSPTLHFGLADIALVDEIEITWPDGTIQTLTNLAANQFMQVTMGENPLSPVNDHLNLPRVTTLGKAHPNPFNPATNISFALAQSGPTRLDIYTVDGRHVRSLVNESMAAGQHDVTWVGKDDSGQSVASGTYFYQLTDSSGNQISGRMALVK